MSPASGSGNESGVALSIVLCTRDRYPMLGECIRAVERQTLDAERFELIVIDNSSDLHAQAAFLQGLKVDCRCDYAIEDRPGLSRARNIGVKLARGNIVAFLDDDAIPDPNWAEAILARFSARPRIGALGGPVEPIWPSARPSWMPPWVDHFLTIVDHGPEPHALRTHEWLVGANLALDKSAVLAVGGFPEMLGRGGSGLMSNEDLAVVRHIVGSGLEAFYEPRMRVRHHIHPERLTQDWLRRRVAWQAVSDLISPGVPPGRREQHIADLRGFLDSVAGRADTTDLLTEQNESGKVSSQLAAIRALLFLLLQDSAERSG